MPPESATLEPPVAAPTPTPTPSPTMDAFDATFNDLEPAAPPTPTPNEPTTRQAPPQDPETGKFTRKSDDKTGVSETPGAGAAASPKVAEKPAVVEPSARTGEFTPPQVAKPSELKSWANRMGERAQKAEKQLVEINRQIKELRANPQQSGDVQALTQELATTKQRLAEHEGELKVTRYERSSEYKDTYEKPYQKAVQNAYGDISELLVAEPNPNDPENPRERQATPADFDEVYQLPLGPATKLAKQKFGDAYTEVLKHRSAVKNAAKTALEAIESHKGKAAEFEQQQTAQQKMEQEGRTRMYGEARQAIAEKYPELFGERDGDTAWNENLNKGRSMADLAFGDRKSLTPQQSVILDAQIHARVSAFPGLRAERDSLKTKVTELEKEVADLRGSAPGKGSPGAVKAGDADMGRSLDQAFDKMVPA